MSVRVITAPEPFVAWELAKKHLRIDDDEDQAYVESLIAAATAWVDGPDSWVGRAFGPQLLEWRLDVWPSADAFRMPFTPELEVASVKYVDLGGIEQTWAFPTPLYFENLPDIRGRAGDIRIRYWAGYGKRDPQDATKWIAEVPKPVRQAVLLIVGHWYANREEVVTGTITAQVPMAAEALLSTFRVFR